MTTGKEITPREYLPAPIRKEQAMYLLKTIWPKAPEVEVIKAAILCQQYGLNPLMGSVCFWLLFLLPYLYPIWRC